MSADPNLNAYLNLIEARKDIDRRFVSIRRVGSNGGGGFTSVVFSANDLVTGNQVAIKVFRPDRDSYRFQCFCREESILRDFVGSPNILGWIAPRGEFVETMTHATGISLDLPFRYFVTQLAVGDIGAVIRDRLWTPEEKILGFREMCKGVQRIRRRGVAHRDIKPSNFLLTEDGELRLSDFGTARRLDLSEPALVATYAGPVGDLRYAAPETLAALHDADPSISFVGDIFALGACFFEMWSGTPLGVQLYSSRFLSDLTRVMGAVDKVHRRRIYDGFVQNLVSAHPLPALSVPGSDLPPCIRDIAEGLYTSMAALDYRERLEDFEVIFLKISQCLLVLKNEEKVRQWRERKEAARQRREALNARNMGGTLLDSRGTRT